MRLSNKRLKQRLLAKIHKTEKGCWEWMGGRIAFGYGSLFDGEKMKKAHRLSYELFKGQIPKGLLVTHQCDNPPCINPSHLKIGTRSDNMQDMALRNRWVAIPYFRDPCRHSHAKLDWRRVNHLRKLFSTKQWTFRELGNKFGIAPNTAKAIAHFRTWQWKDKEAWLKRKYQKQFEHSEHGV